MCRIEFSALILISVQVLLQSTPLSMTANPIISHGKPAYTSSGRAPELVDGRFKISPRKVSDGSWIAINLGCGPSSIFFSWNNPAYSWSDSLAADKSCKNNIAVPGDYDLLTSANSSNGSDGSWETVLRVRANVVSARGHLIDFTGMSWVKMSIISGGGMLDEVEMFDASKGLADSWFFCGTSISANAFKGTPPEQNFADLIAAAHSGYHPAMIRGGIGCIYASSVAADISRYLAMTRGVHYWAIELGTNEAWYGTDSNLPPFISAMEIIIDSCKAAGIEPIIARTIATDSAKAKWQVSPHFLAAVDSLVFANRLIAGPDLYAWFRDHPSSLNSDGVHPNAQGAADIQNLWAQKMSSLYSAEPASTRQSSRNDAAMVTISVKHGLPMLHSTGSGTADVYLLNGRLVGQYVLPAPGGICIGSELPGFLIVKFVSNGIETVLPVMVR